MNAYAFRTIPARSRLIIINLNTYGVTAGLIVKLEIAKLTIANLNTYGENTGQFV